jgi:signal transduction histidine kinase
MGLNSMRERAAQIGGILAIESKAGQGVVVRVRIAAPDRPSAKPQ